MVPQRTNAAKHHRDFYPKLLPPWMPDPLEVRAGVECIACRDQRRGLDAADTGTGDVNMTIEK